MGTLVRGLSRPSQQKAYLIEEDVLSIPAFGRKVFQIAILADTMFLTQLLPKLTAD